MEELSRFDVAVYDGIAMVIIESDLLPRDPSVVVIPLLATYPAVKHLNPNVVHDGQTFVLATRLITAVRRSALHRAGSIADQSERVIRAVDILMSGV